VNKNMGASANADRAAGPADPSPAVSAKGGIPSADPVHEFVQAYEFYFGDGSTHTPTDAERAMLEDAINAWEARPFG
jgi:hypothetical protein